jgi:molybdopterin biosynthesis enzyme
MKDHMLLHQWLALSNPSGDNYSEIKAYLKVSISVVSTGDEQLEIKEEVGPGDDENVMMPP